MDKTALIVSLIRKEEKDIMEVGCGRGEITRHLSSLGKRVIGVEIREEKAAEARRFCNELIIGDIENGHTIDSIRSLQRLYDLILYSEVLEHLSRPDLTLLDTRQFLRPGGAILVVLPNVAFYKTRLMLLRGRWDYTDEGILDRTHLKFFTRKTAEVLIREAGFRVLVNRATHYSHRYAYLYNHLIKWWPGLFGEQFVIRADMTEGISQHMRM